MQQKISIKVSPSVAENETALRGTIASSCGTTQERITGYHTIKKSLDARGRQASFLLTLNVFIDEPYQPLSLLPLQLKNVHNARDRVVIIGSGPAGLFAALRLIECGIKPIILERGKDVRSRRRDLAAMNKEGVVNKDSNYCFGEGGAGTYSDGKLYTRSTKRGDIHRILSILVQYGANERILYDAHPHIGTNKLPQIITSIREGILASGGEVHFEKKLTDLAVEGGKVTAAITADGDSIPAKACILATGHSARDIFHLLNDKGLAVETKPFALGVRVEHPQTLIDAAQYHCDIRSEHLPPASYSLVQQVGGKGVFSFCMCPGGIIAPAATAPGEIVVNGWSPSKRNNPFANSGIVVTADIADMMEMPALTAEQKTSPLLGLFFQQEVEQAAFRAGGGALTAPAQRMADFSSNKTSASLPHCSYLPGIAPADLREVLPPFIHTALQSGFKEFGRRIKGYFTNDAVLVATESRTSSPVRIPRDKETLQHPQLTNLYPCAEGAGYAGGIVSAAMDGERVANAIAAVYSASVA